MKYHEWVQKIKHSPTVAKAELVLSLSKLADRPTVAKAMADRPTNVGKKVIYSWRMSCARQDSNLWPAD